MIDFYNQVPSVYVNASRDFQYLCWLFNIVLNDVKHNVDGLDNLPNSKTDPKLAELLAFTLGFKVKRNYDNKQLAALVSIIPSILKYKGTQKAVTLAGNALITAAGSTSIFEAKVIDNVLEVLLPEDLVDVTLFIDLLPYILPAGMSCRIVRKTNKKITQSTKVYYRDRYYADWHLDLSWDKSHRTTQGLSELFEAGEKEPNFANNNNERDLNTGLLDNSVIPVLEDVLLDTVKTDEE